MVEYALDVIDDNQDQPEGLQKLLESQVSFSFAYATTDIGCLSRSRAIPWEFSGFGLNDKEKSVRVIEYFCS